LRARAEAITVGDLLVRAAEQYGGEPVLDGLTFSGLYEAAVSVARRLIAAEVPRYARVAVADGDDAARVPLMFGVALAGAVVVLGGEDTGTAVVTAIDTDTLPPDPGGLAEALELRRLGARLRDAALVIKGVELTHEAVARTWRAWAQRVGLAPGDRLFLTAPDPVLPSFGALLACLSAGATRVADPAAATLGLVLGGSPVPDPAPGTLLRGYGPAAASGLATATASGEAATGYGAPLPGIDLRIGETGEILVRGYNLAQAGPGAVIDDRGWLHTGDRGTLDERGRLRELTGGVP
jgi:acyl-CoA synthetase (AMP-forming)/AMP-acid ligase II